MNRKEINRRKFLSAMAALGGGLGAPGLWADEKTWPFQLAPAGTFDPGMRGLHGVAIDGEDRLYAAGETGVRVFDKDGKSIAVCATSGPVRAAAFDDEGRIFAGLESRIEVFDAGGSALHAWGESGAGERQIGSLSSIAISGFYIYIADGRARRVSRYAIDGDFVDMIDGFIIPSAQFDLWTDKSGTLYVGHRGRHRVERYDPNLNLLGHWGEFGLEPEKFSGCCNPINLAVFDDGRVATFEKGIVRMKVCDGDGRVLACLHDPTFPQKTDWMDMAIDTRGRIAVADSMDHQIRFYELQSTS